MKERLKFALIGLLVGLLCGLLEFLIAGVIMDGALSYFLWTITGFMLVGAFVGFLLPKKATEYFTQFLLGMMGNGNI